MLCTDGAIRFIPYLFLWLFHKSRNLKIQGFAIAKILPKKGGAPLVRIGFLVFPCQFNLDTNATIYEKGNHVNVVPSTSISQCADRKRNTARFYYRKVEPQ